MVKKEMGRYLPKAKLPSCYDRLVELISRLDYSVGCAHANWKEAGTDHSGK
jgi:hypothetical protein